MRIILRLLWVMALILVISAVSLVAYDYFRTRETFPPRSYINTVDVSLLTRAEAVAKLKDIPLTQLFTPALTLEADHKRFTFKPDMLGVYVLYDDTVDRAFDAVHQGNYFEELMTRFKDGAQVGPLILDVDDDQLRSVLDFLAGRVRTTPKNAEISFYEETGGYNIFSDDPGRELNVNRTIVRFKVRLYKGYQVIPLVIDYQRPKITEAELRSHPPATMISQYTTYYGSHDNPNRIHNIKLVASWVDDTLLMPGDTFSVAEVLGDVTEEQGFREALVIIGGELVPTLGGGACQVATTLFNAASLADLKVNQRRNHSFYFNIYPLGRDAAVYPGQLDFEFENNTPYPVIIKAESDNKKLVFRLYGTPTGKKVRFSKLKILGKEADGDYKPMSLKEVIAKDIPFQTSITRSVYSKKTGQKILEEKIISKYKLYGDKDNVPIRRPHANEPSQRS